MVSELYIFGSLATGEVDDGSDVDVLAVVDGSQPSVKLPASWSVYSSTRLEDLFERGTLFAWHLYQSAIKVWPRERDGLIAELGPPAQYTGAREEIAALLSMAVDSFGELERGTPSVVFE